MKILFVGNSYTYYNEMPEIFRKLARENGHDVEVFSVTQGGQTLAGHLDWKGECFAKTKSLLQEHTFDYCVIQEQGSLIVLEPTVFIGCLKTLLLWMGDRVKNFVLYQTPSVQEGHPRLEQYGWTPQSLTELIGQSYARAAEETGEMLGKPVAVSPAGKHFYTADCALGESGMYNPDRLHPAYPGSCLVALTHYKTIFGCLPEKTDTLAISEEVLRVFLKTVAQE